MDRYKSARRSASLWSRLSVKERIRRLQGAADALLEHLDEIAATIHEENGKPLVEAISHEILPAVAYVRWLREEGDSILRGEERSVKWLPHRRFEVERRPFGVVLVVSPWNIPFFIPFSQTMTALAAGNAVVLKPSEVTPQTARWIERVLRVCELPEGLFQLVEGDGKVGAELVEAAPDKVVFTGSVVTGRKVMASCAARTVPVSLELGGVDAAIVLDDADLDYAASAVAWGATFNHGQVCASVERLLVHATIYDEFLERVTEKLERINPFEDYGRVTFEGQKKTIQDHLDDAKRADLKLHCGGQWRNPGQLEPTLFSDPKGESRVWREETFGPVLVARSFESDDEAIERHNDTSYGLMASVFSTDLERAGRLARELRAGCVGINELGAMHYSQPELPWGGVGDSGFGRSHGREGLLAMTWPQVIDTQRTGAVEFRRPWWYPYNYRLTDAMKSFTMAVGSSGMKRAEWLARATTGMTRVLAHKPRN